MAFSNTSYPHLTRIFTGFFIGETGQKLFDTITGCRHYKINETRYSKEFHKIHAKRFLNRTGFFPMKTGFFIGRTYKQFACAGKEGDVCI
jgi:hypothetical protein